MGQVNMLNVPVDYVPMLLAEVTLEQKKTVNKLPVYLGRLIRQQMSFIHIPPQKSLLVVLETAMDCTSIQTPPQICLQMCAPPLKSASVNLNALLKLVVSVKHLYVLKQHRIQEDTQ